MSRGNNFLTSVFPQVCEASTDAGSPTKSRLSFPQRLYSSTLFNSFGVDFPIVVNDFNLNTPAAAGPSLNLNVTLRNVVDETGVRRRADLFHNLFDEILTGIVSIDTGASAEHSVDYVIRTLMHLTRIVALMEYKCRWKLDCALVQMPITSAGIVASYAQYLIDGGYPEWCYAIAQCVAYMIENRCRFCILTTLNFFYVLHLPTPAATRVHITDRIAITSVNPRGLPLVGVILPSAASPDQMLLAPALMAMPQPYLAVTPPGADPLERAYKCAFLYVLWKAMQSHPFNGPGPAIVLRAAGEGKKDSDKDCDGAAGAVEVMSATEKLQLLGEGRSGAVYKGSFRGNPVAIKLLNKKSACSTLKNEVMVYKRFEALQGSYLPKILSYDLKTVGGSSGLGMQILQPLPLDFDCWSFEQRMEAKELLLSLAGRGLLQQDVRPNNFGLSESGKIMMFDLEDVVCSGDAEYEKKLTEYTADIEKCFISHYPSKT